MLSLCVCHVLQGMSGSMLSLTGALGVLTLVLGYYHFRSRRGEVDWERWTHGQRGVLGPCALQP